VGDGEKLLTHLNSALKVLLGLDIFPRVPKKKLNFVDQCYCSKHTVKMQWVVHKCLTGSVDLKRIEPPLKATPAWDDR